MPPLPRSKQSRGFGCRTRRILIPPGGRTHSVDPEEETLVFERMEPAPIGDRPRKRRFDVRRDWPPVPGGDWPPGFTVSREQIYDESGRLTGEPQGGPESDR